MANAQATTISQLPVQLLARILAMLDPAERLGSAALVATAWRTAAVLGTNTVNVNLMKVSEAVPKRFDSLSAWLATNSYAGITELDATMPIPASTTEQMPVLQLPSLQRLPGLECLHCYGLTITPAQASNNSSKAGAGAAEAAPAAPHTPLQLSAATALTALQLYSCNVEVQGLAALTRLQRLTVGGHLCCNLPDAVTSNLRSQLQQALPQLQELVFLRLFGEVAHDDVLQHVSSLPRLQELVLVDAVFTPASFQQLPQSLNHLSVEWAESNTSSRQLSASTAPGLCALKGLQEFEVRAGLVSMEVLANMTALKDLDMMLVDLQGPGTLSVLTALTQLTRLSLPFLEPEAALLSNADTAAVTASSQLVELDISETCLSADKCQHIFAANRQLLQLTELRVSLDSIHDGPNASRVAACCPSLASLILTPRQTWDPAPADFMVAEDLASMLRGWQPPQLQHLTSLTLEMQDLPMFPEVWQALARLTQLRVLRVSIDDLRFLAGVQNLTSCRRLKSLCVDARSTEGMERVWLDVTGEEAGDGSTDLAQQLPKALQQSILQQVSEDNGTPELLAVLARCAADVQQAQEQQLAQQQGEIAQLRRELKGVQASLAAVMEQLQGQAGAGTS